MTVFVEDLLSRKNEDLLTISPSAWVYDAIALMAERRVGALVVTEGGAVLGIVTERDYARKMILEGKSSRTTRVEAIMTRDVIAVSRERSLDECMALMTAHRIRHLPVVVDGRAVGMVSIGDAVKAMLVDRDETIEQLERYIKRAPYI